MSDLLSCLGTAKALSLLKHFQSRENLWSASTNKLTNVIEEIIDFAKIRKLRNAFFESLERELARNPPLTLPQGDVSICNLLVSKCTALRLDPAPGSWISHLFTFFSES